MSNWHALHYNKIAKMIREKRTAIKQRWEGDFEAIRSAEIILNELTLEFTTYFKTDNVVFDERKFVEACGFKGGE